jgi:hypothetical protein
MAIIPEGYFYDDDTSYQADPSYQAADSGGFWDTITGGLSDAYDYITDIDFKDPNNTGFVEDIYGLFKNKDGSLNTSLLANIGAVGGSALLRSMGFMNPEVQKVGYQGGIPSYTATREQVPTLSPTAAAEAKEYVGGIGYKPTQAQLSQFTSQLPAGSAQPYQYDPDRRPGSSGRRYFTDVQYTAPDQAGSARTGAQERALGLAALNAANPATQGRPAPPVRTLPVQTEETTRRSASDVIKDLPVEEQRLAAGGIARLQGGGTPAQAPVGPMSRQDLISLYETNPREAFRMVMSGEVGGKPQSMSYARTYLEQLKKAQAAGQLPSQQGPQPAPQMGATTGMAQGGIASVRPKGYYLGGITDGMADQVPAQIDNQQPAALSDGEFVIPSDVVSHLGNGNSSAGAKQLYGMMDRVRQERTGTKQQGKQINPNKFVPA